MRSNWLQLFRFFVVGVGGYLLNLVVFAVCVRKLGFAYGLAAVLSFLVAVSNNFVWHRRWTFDNREHAVTHQGARFLAISLVAFVGSFLVLQGLVKLADADEVIAQATALATVVPVSFVLNKVWSFAG